MKRAIAWFAENGVAANLLMLFVLAWGLMTIPTLRQEVFPELSADLIRVSVPYPGAAPEEVEEGVVARVEEAIRDLEGVKSVQSTAAENQGTVLVEAIQGADLARLETDVRSRVDAIDTFPDEAEEPVVEEVIQKRRVIEVAVAGRGDEKTLKRLAERVRDDLVAQPEITQVQLAAARPYEVSVEVSEEALQRYGLAFDDVAEAIRRSSLDLPGGRIDSRSGEILLRAEGQAYRRDDFAALPVAVLPDGSRVTVSDVATVRDGFADTDNFARFDGEPAVLVQVFRVGEQGAIEIADAVKRYIQVAQPGMPEGIELKAWQDDTLILRSRLDLLRKNGMAGFALVVVVLALFLKVRLAGWVSLGIPISFLGAVALMPTLDVSVNLISLFAFIVVLGIVVDDAIIVGENIYQHHEKGKDGLAAAVDGAQEVAVPVTFAVLTSIAAFAPLLAVGGVIGKIMRIIPLVVIATLVFSLIESLWILPNHLSHLRQSQHREARTRFGALWKKVQRGFSAGLDRFIDRVYQPLLERALMARYVTIASGLAILFVTFGLVAGGWLQFNFLPPIEADNVAATLTMPQGTPVEVTGRAVSRLETAALEIADELEEETGETVIRHVLTSVGDQPFSLAQSQNGGGGGGDFSASHLGEVTLELAPAEERSVTSTEIADRWRERAGPIADAVELGFTSSIFSAGDAIDIELSGPDLAALQRAAGQIKSELAQFPGVRDIADSYREGKKELEIRLTREGELAGLHLVDLGRQVRQAFFGEEAQRIQRNRDDVKVMVRYPADRRTSLADLESLRVRGPNGVEVPFGIAADVTLDRGPASIRRKDQRRVLNVTADVDISETSAAGVLAELRRDVLPRLLQNSPDIRYTFVGEQEEQRDTMSGLGRGFAIALIVIYALLAIPFRSYAQPLIVMSAIPFGLIGAIWGHVVMGFDMAILSVFGIVALTGVVVNDSLVMVDFINRSRQGGMPILDAIRTSGSRRFRPILLTSLTTFAGLTPLLLEKSVQAQFLIPMAISLGFGVLFATFISLLLVPCLYSILEDLKAFFARLRSSDSGAEVETLPESLEPAAEAGSTS